MLDHSLYWDRVAAHLTFRHAFFKSYDMSDISPETCSYRCPSKWFWMTNLEEGYYKAMNHFLALIPEIMAHKWPYEPDEDLTEEENTREKQHHNPDKYGMQFYVDKPLDVQTRFVLGSPYNLTQHGDIFTDNYQIATLSTRKICAIWVENNHAFEMNPRCKKLREWIHMVDDMFEISVTTKRQLITGLMQAINPTQTLDKGMELVTHAPFDHEKVPNIECVFLTLNYLRQ